MNLDISPDLNPVCCYAAIFLVGFFVAFVQINRYIAIKNVGGARTYIRGVWKLPSVWLIFVAFILIPIALYWILDRTSVIHDSSLLAAILVAVTYERILNRTSPDLKAPEVVSTFWQPFLNWIASVSAVAGSLDGRNNLRLAQQVITIALDDPTRFAILKEFAMVESSNPVVLNQNLIAIDAMFPLLGADGVSRKKAELLYNSIRAVDDVNYRLKKRKFFPSSSVYFWNFLEGRSALSAVGGVLIVLLIIAGPSVIAMRSPSMRAWYYAWRLEKANTTEVDQTRARIAIEQLALKPDGRGPVYKYVQNALMRPDIPPGRAEIILAALLTSRPSNPNSNDVLPALLIASLRTSNIDSRDRIQRALVFLASNWLSLDEKNKLWASLKDWAPTADKSTIIVEGRIDDWNVVWGLKPASTPATAHASTTIP